MYMYIHIDNEGTTLMINNEIYISVQIHEVSEIVSQTHKKQQNPEAN